MIQHKENWISKVTSIDSYYAGNKPFVKIVNKKVEEYNKNNVKKIKPVGHNSASLLAELTSEYNYWEDKNKLTEEGFFFSTIENIYDQIGLNRYQQDEAIKILKYMGVIEVKSLGLPSKRHFKINFDVYESYLRGYQEKIEELKEEKKGQKTLNNSGCESTANKDVEEEQTSMQKESKQVCDTKATNNNNYNNNIYNNNNSNKEKKEKNHSIHSNYIKEEEKERNEGMFQQFLINIDADNLYVVSNCELRHREEKNICKGFIGFCEDVIKSSENREFFINNTKYFKKEIVDKIMKLNFDNMLYLVECYSKNTTEIINNYQYMLKMIWTCKFNEDAHFENRAKTWARSGQEKTK